MSSRTEAKIGGLFLLAGLGLGGLGGGCAASRPSGPPAPEWLYSPAGREYVVETADVMEVRFLYQPELDSNDVAVRADGRISLPLIPDLEVRGKTLPAIEALLAAAYVEAGLKEPEISLALKSSAGLRVFVGGEVERPGMVPYTGRVTLLAAIMEAGGPRNSAALGSVALLRDPGDEASEPLFAVVDADRLLEGGRDPLLQAYDIVFVPKSRIAKLNQLVEQYFVKLVPITTSAGFQYTWGRLSVP